MTRPFTPFTILRVAAIINRITDARVRNKIAIDFAELLHEDGYHFNEAALLRLCRFDWCAEVGGHRFEGPKCRVCHNGRGVQ